MGSIRNPISRICRLFVPVVIAAACCAVAQDSVSVVVFSEEGFPSADCSSPSRDQLKNILPAARFTSAEALKSALAASSTKLLVLPYGSAFPESAWSEIYAYLQRGGNLLVLGGQPFTRAAYHDAQGWHLRDYSVRFIQPLSIDQFQETPGSEGLTFEPNPDV